MSLRYLVLCLTAAAAHAGAAEAISADKPVAQRAAQTAHSSNATTTTPAVKPVVGMRLAAPLISETKAVRNPDGSIGLNCTQRPNPKASAINAKLPIGANAKAPQS